MKVHVEGQLYGQGAKKYSIEGDSVTEVWNAALELEDSHKSNKARQARQEAKDRQRIEDNQRRRSEATKRLLDIRNLLRDHQAAGVIPAEVLVVEEMKLAAIVNAPEVEGEDYDEVPF